MKRILLVEDDTILRENTAELLELANYEVIAAPNGKIGVEKALANTPDIIVCDVMMPEWDGYGVLQALSKEPTAKYIPFIFLSAKTERQDIRKGMDLGADDYITKPFEEEELTNAIESRIAKAVVLKEERENHVQKEDENQLRDLNDLKNFFDDNGTIFNFAKDEIVYEEGHSSNYIYLIIKGVVKCHKFDE